jgi:hypothetical protein
VRTKLHKIKSWPSKDQLHEELQNVMRVSDFLGLYDESPFAVERMISREPPGHSSPAHGAHSQGALYTVRSWIPPFLPWSKWNDSKRKNKSGSSKHGGKKRNRKQTTVKRTYMKKVRASCGRRSSRRR